MTVNPTILIQARIGSSRLRSKVLRQVQGRTLLKTGFLRLRKSRHAEKIIYLIPETEENQVLKSEIDSFGGEVFFGSENDVMSRYLSCSREYNLEKIIRITSDCPLVDPREVDKLIAIYQKINNKNLYISNFTPPEYSSYCNGSDIEIFTLEMLEKVSKMFQSSKDREHVTFPFWDGRFNCDHLKIGWGNKINLKNIRLTIDYEEDIKVMEFLSTKINLVDASLEEICEIYKKYRLFEINGHFDSKAGWE